MKMIAKAGVAALAAAMMLAGCSKTVRPEDIAGKTYLYEKDGFGGPFTIQLKEDGTFTYYEGFLSSYIGVGEWTLEKDIVTLNDEYLGLKCFQTDGENLTFQAENSRDFLYVKVSDGEKFTAVAE